MSNRQKKLTALNCIVRGNLYTQSEDFNLAIAELKEAIKLIRMIKSNSGIKSRTTR